MNFTLHSDRFRIGAAVLAAALVAVLISILSASPALAGGGGVGTGGGSGSGGEETSSNSGDRYDRIWDRTSSRDKRWARKTSECESGGDPNAIGGGGKYRGAFQFMRSTWNSSPKTPGGDPIDYSYKVQAVVATQLMKRDGKGHWPVCG